MQFSIRTILVLVAFCGWIVCVFMPGGLYVALPVGIGVFLFLSCLHAGYVLRKENEKSRWRKTQLVASALMLILLLVVYPPFWSFAAGRANRDRDIAAKRAYIMNTMDAELVCEDGQTLLAKMHSDSTQTLFASSSLVPNTLRELNPVYLESRDDYLLVVLGNEPDSFDLLIYADGMEGRGTRRLCKGLWFFQPGSKRWITDAEWDAGVRE